MSRKTIFTETQIKEMKDVIRTGEPIAMLAEKLATKYNVPEDKLRSKLYNVAKRTRKIADWNGPKQRRTRMRNVPTPSTPSTLPTPLMGKMVVMHQDHIRIYF
jgi:hypothetical protein